LFTWYGSSADDDRLAAVVLVHLDGGARLHAHAAAAGVVRGVHAGDAVDDRRGREIRAGDVLHQLADGDFRIVDQRDGRAHDFAEVVRRDVGGHAHAMPAEPLQAGSAPGSA
jgi:hypothetical protein